MADRVYIEGHRPAMGWWNGNGFVASCDCGYTTVPAPSRRLAEQQLQAGHLAEMEQRHAVIVEQDAVELPDDDPWPEGF